MERKNRQENYAILQDMEKYVGSRIFGYIYLYITKPVLEQFGMEGEKTIRRALRAFGKRRGERQLKWHEEEKLPINIESWATFSDMGSTRFCGCENQDMMRTAFFTEFWARKCPLYDVVREADYSHWGYLYCDEMHLEMIRAYHPKAVLEIHECLMKEDNGCHFLVMMPPEEPSEDIGKSQIDDFQRRIKNNPIDFQRLMLQREGMVAAILYYSLAKAVIKKFGQNGKTIITSALTEIGRRRGSELRNKLQKVNAEITWDNIWDNFDLGYKYGWKIDCQADPDRGFYISEIRYCPMAEIWNEYEDLEIGSRYCDITYETMFEKLIPGAQVNLVSCLSKMEDRCRLEIRL
jgi:hypothetical protein